MHTLALNKLKMQPESSSFRGFKEDERCRFRSLKSTGIRVVVRLTYRCDLHCPHCLVDFGNSRHELDTRAWCSIFSQLPLICTEKVLLTGGEPLLRKDIVTLVDTISQLGIPVDLNTNLQKMNLALMHSLRQAGLTEISVSLEGPKHIHDAMHGKSGAFDKCIKAIHWAAERGIQVDVSCCVTNENLSCLMTVVELASSLPVQSLTLSRMFPIGHGKKIQQSPTQVQLNEVYKHFAENVIPEVDLPIRLVGLLNPPQPHDCRRADSLVGMTPEGNLQGCVLAGENPVNLPHPLDGGLKKSFVHLQRALRQKSYRLCWDLNDTIK